MRCVTIEWKVQKKKSIEVEEKIILNIFKKKQFVLHFQYGLGSRAYKHVSYIYISFHFSRAALFNKLNLLQMTIILPCLEEVSNSSLKEISVCVCNLSEWKRDFGVLLFATCVANE